MLLYFDFEKRHSYFGFSIVITVDVFSFLFWVFEGSLYTLYIWCMLKKSKNLSITSP